MATEVQTVYGECPTHGPVEATRVMPKMGFPFIYYAIRRSQAKNRPFLCPTCGSPVEAS